MKKIFVIFIALTSISFSQSAGNSGLSFLKLGFGARNVAMGDAGSSASNDVTALFYNPARLAGQEGSEILLMHNEWIEGIRSELLGAKFQMFGLNFAAGFNLTTISDIEVRETAGPATTTFNANYFYGSLSTGFNIVKSFQVGASIKFLYENLYTDQANGLGFDFGINYLTPVEGLTASASIKNIGSTNELRSEPTKLPSELRTGAGYSRALSTQLDLNTALELQKYLDTDDIHFLFGAEVIYDNLIALRGGYLSGYISRDFTGGIGLIWGNLKFDYALSPFVLNLGMGHTVSVGFKF